MGFFVTMKTCYKCKVEKDITEFSKNQGKCKLCEKLYRELNKEKRKLVKKEYYERNKYAIAERRKKHYESNKEEYSIRKKEYSKNNKKKISESGARYYQLNKERIIQKNLIYRIENKDKLHAKKREYVKKRLNDDPVFKLGYITRGLICKSFKRGKKVFSKKTKTAQILGCSIAEFKSYLESKFSEGMTFDNHGAWHLDHIIPISTAITEEDIIKLNHYTNFQPLWANDNLKKGKKIVNEN